MKHLTTLILIIVATAFLLLAFSQVNESAAHRAEARAAVIRATSQARLDATAAFLPYVAIVAVIILGCVFVVTAALVVLRLEGKQSPPGPLQIVERVIIVLPEGEGRRAMWERSALAIPERSGGYRQR